MGGQHLAARQIRQPIESTHDIRNAMKLMPGVVQDQRGGLHFSGGAENEVLYTLDGFNVSNPLDGLTLSSTENLSRSFKRKKQE